METVLIILFATGIIVIPGALILYTVDGGTNIQERLKAGRGTPMDKMIQGGINFICIGAKASMWGLGGLFVLSIVYQARQPIWDFILGVVDYIVEVIALVDLRITEALEAVTPLMAVIILCTIAIVSAINNKKN